MKILNVLWVEDVERNKKAIWYNLEPELGSLDIEFIIDWQNSGRYAATLVRDRNRNRGRVGFPDTNDMVQLMLVDYNLEETLKPGQIIGIDGASVIRETRLHDNDLPILFYSSNNEVDLANLIEGENMVYSSHRDNIIAEIIRLLKMHF